MNAFKHCKNLLNFATNGLVLALAFELLGLQNIHSTGDVLNHATLRTTTAGIVGGMWLGPTMEVMSAILDSLPHGQAWDSNWCIYEEATTG